MVAKRGNFFCTLPYVFMVAGERQELPNSDTLIFTSSNPARRNSHLRESYSQTRLRDEKRDIRSIALVSYL